MAADKPDFDLTGMVEAALAKGADGHADALRCLLEGLLTVNQNVEAMVEGVNGTRSAMAGAIRAMQALNGKLEELSERIAALERVKKVLH